MQEEFTFQLAYALARLLKKASKSNLGSVKSTAAGHGYQYRAIAQAGSLVRSRVRTLSTRGSGVLALGVLGLGLGYQARLVLVLVLGGGGLLLGSNRTLVGEAIEHAKGEGRIPQHLHNGSRLAATFLAEARVDMYVDGANAGAITEASRSGQRQVEVDGGKQRQAEASRSKHNNKHNNKQRQAPRALQYNHMLYAMRRRMRVGMGGLKGQLDPQGPAR